MIIRRQRYYSFHSDGKEEMKMDDMVLKKSEPGKFGKFLGKVIKPISKLQDQYLSYDVYKDSKKIGLIEFNEENKDTVNCEWVWIDFNFRGEQRATNLLQHFINLFKKLGYKYMTLDVSNDNDGAKHIAEKLGFKIVGTVYSSETHKTIEMKLKLDNIIVKRQREFGRWGDLLYRGASKLMDSLEDNSKAPHSLFEEVDGLYRDSEDENKPDSTYKVKEFFDDLQIEPKNRGFMYRIEIEDWRKKLNPKDYPELFKAMEGGRNKEITVKL